MNITDIDQLVKGLTQLGVGMRCDASLDYDELKSEGLIESTKRPRLLAS